MTSAIAWQAWAWERIGQCYCEFTAQLGRTILDPGLDEIHGLRISIRRLRLALDLCQERPRKTLRRGLKHLMALAGKLRDCDITSRHFERAKLPDIGDRSRRERKKVEQDLAQFLCSRAHHLKVRSEEELKVSLDAATGKITLLAEDLFDCGEKASKADASIRQLHQARIALKKLRYTLEMFHPQTDSSQGNAIKQFIKLQKLLGEIHDLSTVMDALPGKKRYRNIHRRLKRQQAKKIRRFQQLWMNTLRPYKAIMIQHWLQWVRLPAPNPSD